MEQIGDSVAVKSVKSLDESIDKFKSMLISEEDRLHKLEDQRAKIEKDIEVLAKEIADEKFKYREAIENLIKAREKLSKKYLEDFNKEFPDDKVKVIKLPSSTSLIESCNDAIESSSNLDLDIKIDTEKLRNDCLAENDKKKTKEEYLERMKELLAIRERKQYFF